MLSRRSDEPALRALAIAGVLLLGACAHAPPRSNEPAEQRPAPAGAAAAKSGSAAPGTPASPGAAAAGAAAAATLEPPPARAVADFNRAVGMMRAGNVSEAELEFQQLALAYPQFAAPDINLGILYRKGGQMEASEQALRAAVKSNGTSAVAWNELGVTLRMRGQFHDAVDAYQKAIAADANFAPAYRNLGVLLDLYLGDTAGALAALEHYKQLSGEDKPVTGWIAELRQRAAKSGMPPQRTEGGGAAGSQPGAAKVPQGAGAPSGPSAPAAAAVAQRAGG
ncbi:MAG TPA: tetratricopeptide repeat protein [Steroidobacteraceae bacterium]|nr:tetratricopeptide repeat protein [Steroidobacteraceae bacterium]